MNILLSPPIAFLFYIPIGILLMFIGHRLAGKVEESAAKTSIYSSGEESPSQIAMPGYKQFFVIALFFAILHLGILVIGTSNLNGTTAIYVVGLLFALLALLLG